jgi:hypothetical protein
MPQSVADRRGPGAYTSAAVSHGRAAATFARTGAMWKSFSADAIDSLPRSLEASTKSVDRRPASRVPCATSLEEPTPTLGDAPNAVDTSPIAPTLRADALRPVAPTPTAGARTLTGRRDALDGVSPAIASLSPTVATRSIDKR